MFSSFTVFNKLKALQLSKVGLSAIKRQESKNLTPWAEATWTKNTWKMQVVCKSLFTKGVHNVYHLHSTMPREWRWCFLHWSIAVSTMPCWKLVHTAINIPSNIRYSLLDRKQVTYEQGRPVVIWFCWKFSVLCSSEIILQIDQELTKL